MRINSNNLNTQILLWESQETDSYAQGQAEVSAMGEIVYPWINQQISFKNYRTLTEQSQQGEHPRCQGHNQIIKMMAEIEAH